MMKNQMGSNDREMSGSAFKTMGDRFTGVIRDIGLEAWDELKTGIDKAWDEIKLGVDEGLQAASVGVNKAWMELAQSVDRAKDSLFMVRDEGDADRDTEREATPARTGSKQSRKKEKDKLN
jgi:hypothetical protein